jgi:hypothetical protein
VRASEGRRSLRGGRVVAGETARGREVCGVVVVVTEERCGGIDGDGAG